MRWCGLCPCPHKAVTTRLDSGVLGATLWADERKSVLLTEGRNESFIPSG